MNYRFIEGDELKILDPVIEDRNWTPIDPKYSRALVAEDDEGNLKGFVVAKLLLHAEPLWVDPKSRGEDAGIARELSHKMADHLRENGMTNWITVCDSPYAIALCEENGMVRSNSPLYRGGK